MLFWRLSTYLDAHKVSVSSQGCICSHFILSGSRAFASDLVNTLTSFDPKLSGLAYSYLSWYRSKQS